MTRVRVAYLQKAPSGHADACLRALARTGKADLFVTMPPTLSDTPYDQHSFWWPQNTYVLRSLERDDGLLAELRRFRPDVTLIVGWEQRAYRHCARQLRGASLRVVCMDNQWLRTPKQLLGIATSRLYLRPYFDAAFVAGSRQMAFALRLGFARERIFEGFDAADVDAFRSVEPLETPGAGTRSAFVFVGRLVSEKGIADLIKAYRLYRDSAPDPWPLLVFGAGPLAPLFESVPGIEQHGFVDPAQLPVEFARGSFLVLPSTFEPWGVVVHEATAAGLGCICTTAVGAADVFVRDGVNGRIVRPNAPADLAEALRWAHRRSPDQRAEVTRLSRKLAGRLTPERWAATVLGMRLHSTRYGEDFR